MTDIILKIRELYFNIPLWIRWVLWIVLGLVMVFIFSVGAIFVGFLILYKRKKDLPEKLNTNQLNEEPTKKIDTNPLNEEPTKKIDTNPIEEPKKTDFDPYKIDFDKIIWKELAKGTKGIVYSGELNSKSYAKKTSLDPDKITCKSLENEFNIHKIIYDIYYNNKQMFDNLQVVQPYKYNIIQENKDSFKCEIIMDLIPFDPILGSYQISMVSKEDFENENYTYNKKLAEYQDEFSSGKGGKIISYEKLLSDRIYTQDELKNFISDITKFMYLMWENNIDLQDVEFIMGINKRIYVIDFGRCRKVQDKGYLRRVLEDYFQIPATSDNDHDNSIDNEYTKVIYEQFKNIFKKEAYSNLRSEKIYSIVASDLNIKK